MAGDETSTGGADAPATKVSRQRIFLCDLTLACKLGVSERERTKTQRIRINVGIEVVPQRPIHDDPANIVDYRTVVPSIRQIAQDGAPRLLESLADRIAGACFFDERITAVTVRIEKLDRYSDAHGIGVEVEHRRDGA